MSVNIILDLIRSNLGRSKASDSRPATLAYPDLISPDSERIRASTADRIANREPRLPSYTIGFINFDELHLKEQIKILSLFEKAYGIEFTREKFFGN